VNPHFLEDVLPVYLSIVTLVVNRGEEFQVLRLLSHERVRNAVRALDFPLYFLNSVFDRKNLEIMQACPGLKEVTVDMCVDHLLRPKQLVDGTQVSWESTPRADVVQRYGFEQIARLSTLTVLKYRLISDCYGWKRQFVEPVLGEVAKCFSDSTGGRISFLSLGWVGLNGSGYGARLPTVRGDGLSGFIKQEPDIMDCFT
jgi:hypothetical protein